MCKELDLFGAELVGIDGTFMRGNVGKDSIYTAKRLKRALGYIEADILAYLKELEQADQQEGAGDEPDPELVKKLAQLRERQAKRQAQLAQLEISGETQVAEVDADARLLSKKGHGTIAGYNVQTAVDEKNKLIVAISTPSRSKSARSRALPRTFRNQTNRPRRDRKVASPGMTSPMMPRPMSTAARRDRN